MKRFLLSLCGISICVLMVAAFVGCSQKKSEVPVGEIMNNTANVAEAQNAAILPPSLPQQEMAASIAEPTSAVTTPTPEQIQTALKNAGYYTGTVDGKIGPKSKKAIETFQKDSGLKIDGKVGSKTWAKLQAHLNRTAPAAASAGTYQIAD